MFTLDCLDVDHIVATNQRLNIEANNKLKTRLKTDYKTAVSENER